MKYHHCMCVENHWILPFQSVCGESDANPSHSGVVPEGPHCEVNQLTWIYKNSIFGLTHTILMHILTSGLVEVPLSSQHVAAASYPIHTLIRLTHLTRPLRTWWSRCCIHTLLPGILRHVTNTGVVDAVSIGSRSATAGIKRRGWSGSWGGTARRARGAIGGAKRGRHRGRVGHGWKVIKEYELRKLMQHNKYLLSYTVIILP